MNLTRKRSGLEPSSKLTWTDCDTNRQCARFVLPLNYADPDDTRSAIIAIVRIPSPLSGTTEYAGPILLNPGGPGGSGVSFVENNGDSISTIVGPQFDIVSFDPRGVSRSRPRVSIFDSCQEAQRWGGDGSLNSSSDAYATRYGVTHVRNIMAHDRDRDRELRFLTTDLVARDITQAMGFGELKYWGFSYGSVLGATFAAMFPENVGRVILDGVMDLENYHKSRWDTSLVDTKATLSHFFQGCAAAGSRACAFYDETPELIEQNLATLTTSIQRTPLPVIIHGDKKSIYGIVDYSMVKNVIFQTLYRPVNFPRLASALADLQKGNGTALFLAAGLPQDCSCAHTPFASSNIDEASHAIICLDGEPIDDSFDELFANYERMRDTVSEWHELLDERMACSGWKVKPLPRFTGPFVANTSHPILLIGNTADPVTPLRSAHKASKGFPSSVVLQQDSPGHCLLAAVSMCTARYVRAYFVNGTLPEPGTVCGVDTKLFPLVELELQSQDTFVQNVLEDTGREGRDLLEALKSLNAGF